MRHNSNDLVTLFNTLFSIQENTLLVSGSHEPFYLAAKQAQQKHEIRFTHDYFSSALHEVAHWCIAGKERRQQDDYGYWYAPDGRNHEQQKQFETVEIKPQALELIFSLACQCSFRVSSDNLTGTQSCTKLFSSRIQQQAQTYLSNIDLLPTRARLFLDTLLNYYQSSLPTPENLSDYLI